MEVVVRRSFVAYRARSDNDTGQRKQGRDPSSRSESDNQSRACGEQLFGNQDGVGAADGPWNDATRRVETRP